MGGKCEISSARACAPILGSMGDRSDISSLRRLTARALIGALPASPEIRSAATRLRELAEQAAGR
jgi:hypothetical protein